MSDRELKKYLQQSLQQKIELEQGLDGNGIKLEETIKLCTEMMREQKLAQKAQEEPRIGFVQYLSDILRFEGIPIFGLQAIVLCITCLTISTVADIPEFLPVFMPLFVLVKLVLAGAANLVCMTVLISLEVHLQNSYREISQIIL